MPEELPDDTKEEILRLSAFDYDKTEIADELGINRNTVRRHLRRFRERFERGTVDIRLVDN